MDNNSNMLQLCRLCLVKDDVNIPIFEEQGDIRQIFLKISSCLPVKVSRDDRLPKKICDGCSYKLDMLYEFWNTSANAEKQLLTWLGEAGMTSQMADGTISAVAQQIKPADAFVKQETIDPPDISMDDEDDEEKEYMKQEENSNNIEEPPPKRARRTAAVKAAIALDQNSDDDDDSGEPMTKIEDDSEDSDIDDREPAFVDVPSTSADDQPGPSGVGKEGVEAPSPKKLKVKRDTSDKNARQKSEKPKKEQSPLPELVKLQEPIVCVRCNKSFDYDVDYAVHSIKHSKDNKYTCHLCPNYKNIRRDRMEIHIRRHDNPKKRGRPATGRKPKIRKRDLNGEKYKKTALPDPVVLDEPIKCKECEQSFDTNLDYALHSIEHSKELKYSCHLCNFTNLRKDRFEIHVRLHEGSTKFKCDICHKAFRCGSHADEHRNYHTGEKPFQCEICGKHFMYSRGLANHRIKTHSQILTGKPREKFHCEFCDKVFESSTGLTSHTNIKHKNIQPDISVICEICGKRISCMGRLKYHLRVHSGDKPYACLMCPKRFAMRDLLIEHSRVHTGEKPYVCKYCGKTFGQRSPYRYHIKTHTGEKPYPCPICGKGFISKAGMKSHVKNCFKP